MEDDWFSEDPFNSIVKQFFGESGRRTGGQRQRIKDEGFESEIIDSDGAIYIVVELPGFSEKDISVEIKDKILEIRARKIESNNMIDYLSEKLNKGVVIRKHINSLPKVKNFKFTCRNGILEIKFPKK